LLLLAIEREFVLFRNRLRRSSSFCYSPKAFGLRDRSHQRRIAHALGGLGAAVRDRQATEFRDGDGARTAALRLGWQVSKSFTTIRAIANYPNSNIWANAYNQIFLSIFPTRKTRPPILPISASICATRRAPAPARGPSEPRFSNQSNAAFSACA
jgi:hypothetical protein